MAKKLYENALLENAKLGTGPWRNFSGKGGPYNEEGNRQFTVFLDTAVAEQMGLDGWNVRALKQREEDEEIQWVIDVTVGYKGRPPAIWLVTSRGKTPIGEDEVNLFDWADIEKSDIILRPYNWEKNGNSGVKAYLKSAFFTIREDELDLKYADVEETTASGRNSRPFFEDTEEDRFNG